MAILSTPSSPNVWDWAVKSLNPRHWYRADTYTLSGGNLATLPNRGNGGGHLGVIGAPLATPEPVVGFSGAPAIKLSGTSGLKSNLLPSAFRYLHNGAGFETFLILAPDGPASTQRLLSTNIHPPSNGLGIYRSGINAATYILDNGSAAIWSGAAGTGSLAAGSFTYIHSRAASSQPLQNLIGVATTVFTGQYANTFNTGDPAQTLHVGSGPESSGLVAQGFVGSIADCLLFDRVLTEYERQQVRAYIQSRYGITAPVVSRDDMNVLKLNPFSWIRADYYASTAEKVTAFLDKAMHGHVFSQSATNLQVNNPTPSALFNNNLVAVSTGTQYYTSSLPANLWSFAHDGTGFKVWFVSSTSTTAVSFQLVLESTNAIGITRGFNLYKQNNKARTAVSKTTGYAMSDNIFATLSVDTPSVLSVKHGSTMRPQYTIKHSGQPAITSAYNSAPEAGVPYKTMRLLGRAEASFSLVGNFADVIFSRGENAKIDAVVEEYLYQRYGLTV